MDANVMVPTAMPFLPYLVLPVAFISSISCSSDPLLEQCVPGCFLSPGIDAHISVASQVDTGLRERRALGTCVHAPTPHQSHELPSGV